MRKERLTHERSNGIKTGYWSLAKRDDLVQRLAEYENLGFCPEDLAMIMKLYDSMVARYGWRFTEYELPKEDGEYIVAIHGAMEPTTLQYDSLNKGWYNSDLDATPIA